MKSRELTRDELSQIRELTGICANYDKEYKECCYLDGCCYMHTLRFTGGGICRYFERALLPLNPQLQVTFSGDSNAKKCAMCGGPFLPAGKQKYCSIRCRNQGNREKSRQRMQRKRQGV